MAENVEREDLFSDEPEKEEDKNYPVSIYLSREEKEEIERLAEKAGISRHAFMQHGVLYFASKYKEDPGVMETKQAPKKPEL